MRLLPLGLAIAVRVLRAATQRNALTPGDLRAARRSGHRSRQTDGSPGGPVPPTVSTPQPERSGARSAGAEQPTSDNRGSWPPPVLEAPARRRSRSLGVVRRHRRKLVYIDGSGTALRISRLREARVPVLDLGETRTAQHGALSRKGAAMSCRHVCDGSPAARLRRSRRGPERVVDEHAGDPPSGLEVFGDESGCAGAAGRLRR